MKFTLLLFETKFQRIMALLIWSYIIAPAFVLYVRSVRSDPLCDLWTVVLWLLSVHGNSQARILEWVGSSFSRKSS